MPDRVRGLLAESLKVPHQSVRKRVAGTVRVSIGAEIDGAVVRIRTRVLVLPVPGIHGPKLERVASLLPCEIIGKRDIGGGRKQ